MTTTLMNSANELATQRLSTASYGEEIFTKDGYFYKKRPSNPTSIVIGDVRNALKRGKNCTHYSIVSPYTRECAALDLRDTFKNLEELYTTIDAAYVERQRDYTINGIQVTIHRTVEKGIRTFSPFATLPRLKKAPATWTMAHVYKALLNGQFTNLKCDMRTTDDYAWDAADNFGRGSIDGIAFVRSLVERPGGWRTYLSDGRVNVNCHHFDYNSFVFDLNAKIA